VAEELPNLEYLALDGIHLRVNLVVCPTKSNPTLISAQLITTQKILRYVRSMPHLQTLCLPRAGELGLGFDGGPGCGTALSSPHFLHAIRTNCRNPGNAYHGPNGAKLRESVAKQHEEAANKAAAMVLQAFGFETAPVNLWVGRSHRFELVRVGNGQRPEYMHHLGTREKVVETYFY
jgi:hypothetical protein